VSAEKGLVYDEKMLTRCFCFIFLYSWVKYYDEGTSPPSEYWYNETSGDVFYEDGNTAEVFTEAEPTLDGEWAGWEQLWDDDNQAYYWYNSETGEVFWD
jgi:hypothetical protein